MTDAPVQHHPGRSGSDRAAVSKLFSVSLKPLLQFEDALRNEPQHSILFSLEDYLVLVGYTGRIIHPNKRGRIAGHTPPIFQRLGLSSVEWLADATQFEDRYRDNQRAHLRQRRRFAT